MKKIGEEAFGYVYVGSTGFTKKVPDFTIYGVKGTEAERYANDNGFKFIEIDAVEPENPGDISGDGVVNANDAIMIQRHVAGLETLSADQLKAADLNNDGIVDAGDAIAILRVDAGLAS